VTPSGRLVEDRSAEVLALATYVPPGRLSVDEVRRHWASADAPGVRTVAVAGFDEDAVTLAVEAARGRPLGHRQRTGLLRQHRPTAMTFPRRSGLWQP